MATDLNKCTRTLTVDETNELHELENIINGCLAGFVDAGAALNTIKNERLFRDEFATFDEYCTERWSIKKNYAYKLIAAANMRDQVPELQNESQSRELGKTTFVDRPIVMKKAVAAAKKEGVPVATRHIKEAATEPSSLTSRVDQGWEGEISDLWGLANDAMNSLTNVARKLSTHYEGVWLAPHEDTLRARLKDIRSILANAVPAGGCPDCAGGLKRLCDTCSSRGWLPKHKLLAAQKAFKQRGGAAPDTNADIMDQGT